MGFFERLYRYFWPAVDDVSGSESAVRRDHHAPLVEYLYVDQRRLNTYFEQISPGVAYDKVPVWRAGMGVTGPTAEAEQARFGRSFSTHEKIQKLIECVKHLPPVDLGDGPRPNPLFRLETVQAIKVVIPPKPAAGGAHGLVLWLSARPSFDIQRGQRLILIQEYRKDDQDYVDLVSPKTALVELLAAAREQLVETAGYEPLVAALQGPFLFHMAVAFEKEFSGGQHGRCSATIRAEFAENDIELTESAAWNHLTDRREASAPWEVEITDGSDRYLLVSESENRGGAVAGEIAVFKNVRHEIAAKFATRPTEILQQLGARASESRPITTLYRVRSWMVEGVMPNDLEYRFGYPIFIAEGHSAEAQ